MDKRLFLLGLALLSVSPVAAAQYQAPEISGGISLDAVAPFEPSTATNALYLSGAKIKIKGALSEDWKYEILMKHPATEMALLNFSDSVQIKSALVKYQISPEATLSLGKTSPRFSQASAPSDAFINRDIGVLSEKIGDEVGAKVEGMLYEKYGYSVGAWKATARAKVDQAFYSEITVESSDEQLASQEITQVTTAGANITGVNLNTKEDLKIAFGGRVNAVLHNTPSFMWGAGFGFQTLGVVVPLVVEYNTQEPTEPTSVFDSRYALTIDQSFGNRYMTFNVAFQHFNYQRENDVKVSTPDSEIPEGVNVFQTKNTANAGYVELTYLLLGKGYKMNKDHGTVSTIELHETSGALELAARVGVESYFNAAAAQYLGSAYNSNPAVPYELQKKSGYNLVVINPEQMTDGSHGPAFQIRAPGFSLHVNYQMNRNIAFKAEYYHQKIELVGATTNTTLEKRQGVRMRSEYSF